MLSWNSLWSTSDRPSFESNACPVIDLGLHEIFFRVKPAVPSKDVKRQSGKAVNAAGQRSESTLRPDPKDVRRQSGKAVNAGPLPRLERDPAVSSLSRLRLLSSRPVPSSPLLSCTPGSKGKGALVASLALGEREIERKKGKRWRESRWRPSMSRRRKRLPELSQWAQESSNLRLRARIRLSSKVLACTAFPWALRNLAHSSLTMTSNTRFGVSRASPPPPPLHLLLLFAFISVLLCIVICVFPLGICAGGMEFGFGILPLVNCQRT